MEKLEKVFEVNKEYWRGEFVDRLREQSPAVYRLEDDWVLVLDEDNGYWRNQLTDARVTMQVNQNKPTLNALIARASESGDRTYIFYRQRGRPAGKFIFLGEVWCVGNSNGFLTFSRERPADGTTD